MRNVERIVETTRRKEWRYRLAVETIDSGETVLPWESGDKRKVEVFDFKNQSGTNLDEETEGSLDHDFIGLVGQESMSK